MNMLLSVTQPSIRFTDKERRQLHYKRHESILSSLDADFRITWSVNHRHVTITDKDVTLCRWSVKQTIPLSVLARNQTQGFGLEISTRPEEGRERRAESWKKELREVSWRRVTRVTSRHRTAERPVGGDRVQPQWGKTSQDEPALLVGCGIFAKNPR